MATGTVKWFNDAKGYGFLERSDGEEDVFVHYSAVVGEGYRSLTEGSEVEFDVEQDPKGLRAVNVMVTKAAPAPPKKDWS
ncbi:MAG: cold-shock protein [Armatimonadota bacterium]